MACFDGSHCLGCELVYDRSRSGTFPRRCDSGTRGSTSNIPRVVFPSMGFYLASCIHKQHWYVWCPAHILNVIDQVDVHIAVYMIFRFLGGVAGSAFLSIGGGTISDLFTPEEVAT